MNLPHCVYVLLSLKDKRFYIGYSRNLSQRMLDHKYGKVISTKSRWPFELICCEFHSKKQDAHRREKYYEASVGKKGLKLMLREKIKELNEEIDNHVNIPDPRADNN